MELKVSKRKVASTNISTTVTKNTSQKNSVSVSNGSLPSFSRGSTQTYNEHTGHYIIRDAKTHLLFISTKRIVGLKLQNTKTAHNAVVDRELAIKTERALVDMENNRIKGKSSVQA